MADVIEQLHECCRDSQGREMKDFAEPWGCEVGLLRQAATELEALRKRCEAVEAQLAGEVDQNARLKMCVFSIYQMVPPLPLTRWTCDLATDALTELCNLVGVLDADGAIAAAQEPSHG